MNLEPCPFCGAEETQKEKYDGIVEIYTIPHEDGALEVGVDCGGCGISVNFGVFGRGLKINAKEIAEEMWNKRV